MSDSYPSLPVKAVYQDCPKCHDHATTLKLSLVSGSSLVSDTVKTTYLYCPNCGWREDEHLIAEVYARAVGEVEPSDDRKRIHEEHPPQVEVIPGALSTPGIEYQLIPPIVWERLAKRFMLGERRKGNKAWNADSANQHILSNKKFILDRLAHTMSHCLKLMHKIRHDLPLDTDDDAAAITWGGAFAICATERLSQKKESQ